MKETVGKWKRETWKIKGKKKVEKREKREGKEKGEERKECSGKVQNK